MFPEHLVVITSIAHRPVAKASDVAGESVITFPQGCAYRRIAERWLGPQMLASVRVLDLSSYHAIVACVASGTGIAIVPESVLDTVQSKQVRRHELPKVLANVVTPLVWRTGEQLPAVVALRYIAEAKSQLQRRSNARAPEIA
jgi:DNA-binding transcriptional LysR family regulator